MVGKGTLWERKAAPGPGRDRMTTLGGGAERTVLGQRVGGGRAVRKECKECPAEWGVGEEAGQALQKSDPLLIWFANRSDHHYRHSSNPTWQASVSTGHWDYEGDLDGAVGTGIGHLRGAW